MSNTKRVVIVGIAGVGKTTVVNEVLSIPVSYTHLTLPTNREV